jgi:cytochrome c553
MTGFVQNLKDEDIEALAEYFSKQKPALKTEERPSSWLAMDGKK